jgi:integrase/recombinase XerD
VGDVACLRWYDITTNEDKVKDEICLLPDVTKGRQSHSAFINARLKAGLEAYLAQAR